RPAPGHPLRQPPARDGRRARGAGERPGRQHPMSAVWRASRAAVKRRRLQTFVIGLVVLFSTATVVLGGAVLIAIDAAFDKAVTAQSGAAAVVAFDTTKTTVDQVTQTARRPGVQAAAGPFGVAVLR